ncbi:MAG: helix-turn-helix transcriptional regulator [Planctomycetes bacterium]|nr:helix-turn-helix transcriptional regulator [Planctomycetota bacterium]
MVTDEQIEKLLAEYLCARRREPDSGQWKCAIETVNAICRYRADGNAVPMLLGIVAHAVDISLGRCAKGIVKVSGRIHVQCPGDDAAAWEATGAAARAVLRALPLGRLRALTVSRLARGVGLSRSHLTMRLHEEEGVTPHQLILAERLRRAIGMLADRSVAHTVAEIASLVGFADVHYFRRVFREAFGVSPSAFR